METKGNKPLFLVAILFLSIYSAIAQSDSVDLYIKNLNRESYDISFSFAPRINLTTESKKILYFEDPSKISKLIKALSDRKKTVASHLILSTLYDSTESRFSEGSLYKNEKFLGHVFRFNTLEWREYLGGECILKQKDINSIKAYWIKRISEGKIPK